MSTDPTQSTDLLLLAEVNLLLTSSSSTGCSNNVSKLEHDLYLLNVTGVLQKHQRSNEKIHLTIKSKQLPRIVGPFRCRIQSE